MFGIMLIPQAFMLHLATSYQRQPLIILSESLHFAGSPSYPLNSSESGTGECQYKDIFVVTTKFIANHINNLKIINNKSSLPAMIYSS